MLKQPLAKGNSGGALPLPLRLVQRLLCHFPNGYNRGIVHWDLRESIKEADIEVILERGKEKYPEAKPRIISDNEPQLRA